MEGDDLLTPAVLDRIRSAARQLEELPEIERVFSLADAQRLTLDRQWSARETAARAVLRRRLAAGIVPDFSRRELSPDLYWPLDPQQQAAVDVASLGEAIAADPIARHLLSRRGDAQTMLIWLADASRLLNQPQSGIRKQIEHVLRQNDLGERGIHCAGTLILQDWMYDEAIRAITLILPVVALLVCGMVYFLYHRLAYVVLTLVVAGVAIAWTLGVTGAFFGEITLLVAATPALVLILSTADTIHLVSAYRAELQQGWGRREAVRRVVREVGGACLLTSLTTFVGFLSLAVVPAIAVRQMAVACAVGVAGALIVALTLVPMALLVLKPPAALASSASPMNRYLDRVVDLCRRWSLGQPRLVIAAHLAILAGSLLLAATIHFDADLLTRFVPGHPMRRSIDFFHTEMAGTTTIEVTVSASPERLLAPEMLAGLASYEARLQTLPEVEEVSSVLSVFRIVDSLLGTESAPRRPRSEAEARAMLEFLERLAPDAVHGFVAPGSGLLRVAVPVTSTRVMEVGRLARRMESLARECFPADVVVTSSGFYVVVGNAAREILVSQAQGFLLCFACVMIIITLGVRSVRLGLIAVLPNLLPLALLAGILALTSEIVDTDILGVAIISFGLAVDDTIHFLHRYDIEKARVGSREEALGRTFRYTGSAIIRTTVILGFGLLPFGLSSYLSIRLLGTYLVFVLGCAVLADLLLLPALVLLLDGEDPASKRESPEPQLASSAIT